MKIKYEHWNPRNDTLKIVATADEIIKEYQNAGYVLTLRQLYYQFVSRDIIPNSERSYKNLGSAITKARMAGLIDWNAIEDRNRHHNSFWTDEDVLSPINDLPSFIRFDQWSRQETYVEVWVEKEALGNVVSRACTPLMVPYMSCKGYLSASEAWRAGQRFERKLQEGKNCVLIHLGDHDPSGIDMTRDNKDRMDIFTQMTDGVNMSRIALNMDQVNLYAPPPNPAKVTDSRAKEYIKKYGKTSWELDALEPAVLEKLITNEIGKYLDRDIWNQVKEQENDAKQMLERVAQNWGEILPIIEGDV